jgi:hypothetical protein
VAQAVFLTLALKAKDLRADVSWPGWLFTTTRYIVNLSFAALLLRGVRLRDDDLVEEPVCAYDPAMDAFPRTTVGGRSISRLIAGSNWVLGYSHTTRAKDNWIKEHNRNRKRIADILEVFMRHGVDTVLGQINDDVWYEGVLETEQRTGKKAVIVTTPHFPLSPETLTRGFVGDDVERVLELGAARGAVYCLPHQATTDAMVDRVTRQLRQMDTLCRRIRAHGMIPGLSTHMPETLIYADETNLDVATYIQIYNSMGFLMQIEVDWVMRSIQNARHPVITIKPMASGQLRPLQGLTFVWNTIRPQDMVCAGCMTPDEAKELIDMSLAILDRRGYSGDLQETRSKASVKAR